MREAGRTACYVNGQQLYDELFSLYNESKNHADLQSAVMEVCTSPCQRCPSCSLTLKDSPGWEAACGMRVRALQNVSIHCQC